MRLAAVVLLGFALRLYRLPYLGDLEFDEIVSIRYAALPPADLLPQLAGAIFEHPPAFYLALGAWRALLGDSDVLARLFAVIPGTLTIILAYVAGVRLFGAATGTVAAVLVAVAPLTLFYSREVRMYGWMACLALAGLWLFVRALHRPGSPARWIAYGAASAIAAYVHYLGLIVVIAPLATVLLLRRRVPGALRPALFVGAGVMTLAAPWLIVAGGTRASLPALSLSHLSPAPGALWQAWCELVAGPDAAGIGPAIAAIMMLALVGLGLPRTPAERVLVALTLAAGVGGLLFTLALDKPVQPRYLLPIAPMALVCAASALRRHATLAAAGTACLVAGALPFWTHYYTAYRRADYSNVTRQIAALERPDDYVILTGPWQAMYYDYYYTGRLFHTVIPRNAPPPLIPGEAAARLRDLASTHRRLWLVQAGTRQADPENFVERWLLRHTWPAFREPHQNAVLSLYAVEPPSATRPLASIDFGGVLRLAGGWVDAGEVRAADVARFWLEFEVLAPTTVDYKVSLRLVGVDGRRTAVDFDLVDRGDTGETATSSWTLARRAGIRRGLWIPATFTPQPYDVRLVVYDPATLTPLEPATIPATLSIPAAGAPDSGVGLDLGCAHAGCEVSVGTLYVTQSRLDQPPVHAARNAPPAVGSTSPSVRFDGIHWHRRVPASEPLDFEIDWRLEASIAGDWRSVIGVVDHAGTYWISDSYPLLAGTFNLHDWRLGETLAERRRLDLSTLPPGQYRLVLGLRDSHGKAVPLRGGSIEVELARFDLPYQTPLAERVASVLGRLGPVTAAWGFR